MEIAARGSVATPAFPERPGITPVERRRGGRAAAAPRAGGAARAAERAAPRVAPSPDLATRDTLLPTCNAPCITMPAKPDIMPPPLGALWCVAGGGAAARGAEATVSARETGWARA